MSTIETAEVESTWRQGAGSLLLDANCSVDTDLRKRSVKRRCVVRLGTFRDSKDIDGDIRTAGSFSIPQYGCLGKPNPVHGSHGVFNPDGQRLP